MLSFSLPRVPSPTTPLERTLYEAVISRHAIYSIQISFKSRTVSYNTNLTLVNRFELILENIKTVFTF